MSKELSVKPGLPLGFGSPFDSRHLHHLPWKPVLSALSGVPDSTRIVIVRGTTGMRAPQHEFVALGFCDPNWHPNSGDHWFDMNNDHFTDQGWMVTHWCDL